MRIHSTACASLLSFACSGCLAWSDAKPATPQRPTLSSDTSTTAIGTVEIETGLAIDPHDSLDTPSAIKWGIEARTEVFAGWSPYRELDMPGPDGEGVGDLQLGVRHRFADETGTAPSLAFQLNTKLPTGDKSEGLSSGELDFFGALIANKNFGGWSATLFYQAGVLGDATTPDTDIEHAIAIAAGLPVADRLSVFAEVATQLRPETDSDPVFATAGAAYSVRPSLVLDLAFVVGLDDEAADFQILLGLTSNLGTPTRSH